MQNHLINQFTLVPAAQPIRGRILTVGYSVGAIPGGNVSLPAQTDTPRAPARLRPTTPKEHPTELATGLPRLEPVREPSDESIPA
jgi:hypothetical protein